MCGQVESREHRHKKLCRPSSAAGHKKRVYRSGTPSSFCFMQLNRLFFRFQYVGDPFCKVLQVVAAHIVRGACSGSAYIVAQ